MARYLSTILKFIILAIIYIIIFRIIRIMYIDLKGKKSVVDEDEIELALEVLDAPENLHISKGSVYPIHDGMTIGRKEDNTIIINDPFISSYHAKFIVDEDFYIKDLESTNGTFVNGTKITNLTQLNVGDLVEVGRITFKVI
ncbi:MAG: FHA domain-containing protein [Clostridiales bacterium]|nr:FHA domain-containing protein [Clostridiales bacterium]